MISSEWLIMNLCLHIIYLCKRRPFPIDYWMTVQSTVVPMTPLPFSAMSPQCHTGFDKRRHLQRASSPRGSPAAENGIAPGRKEAVVFGWQSRDGPCRSVLIYWVGWASVSGGRRLRGWREGLKYNGEALLNRGCWTNESLRSLFSDPMICHEASG